MKETEQRIAIAEACGWTITHVGEPHHSFTVVRGYRRGGLPEHDEPIPDYIYDLNAMAEAEEVVIYKGLLDSREILNKHSDMLESICNSRPIWWASAYQRAEALLKTIGKWVES